jgi:hypothetical protein
MSKSAFAGFCLTAFAGGVVTTVLVDLISGRSRAAASRSGDEGVPTAPAPLARPAVAPEFQALPPSSPRKSGIEIQPVVDRASVAARAAEEKPPKSASLSPREPVRPQRPAARGRASGARKVAASGGTSAAKGVDDAETRSPGGGWTDPFAE